MNLKELKEGMKKENYPEHIARQILIFKSKRNSGVKFLKENEEVPLAEWENIK